MTDLDHSFKLSGARLCTIASAWLAIVSLTTTGQAWPGPIFLPTGLSITPTAAPGSVYEALNPKLADFPNFIASGALSTAKSPDGKTLLVLVSGHNSLSDKNGNTIAADSNEYVFVFDISDGKPVQKQII